MSNLMFPPSNGVERTALWLEEEFKVKLSSQKKVVITNLHLVSCTTGGSVPDDQRCHLRQQHLHALPLVLHQLGLSHDKNAFFGNEKYG